MAEPLTFHRCRTLALLCCMATLGACKPDTPDLQEARKLASAARAEAARNSATVGQSEGQNDRPSTPTALAPEHEATVVAQVGQSTITLGDVARHIARQPRSARSRYVSPEQRIALLNHLVEFELLANEALRLKLDEQPEVQLALKEALARAVIEDVGQDAQSLSDIGEAELRAYYAEHKESFGRPERRRVSKMVFHTEADARRVAGALRVAVAENPRVTKQVFGDFAQKQSVDAASSVVKGDIGWINREGLNARGQRRLAGVLLSRAFTLETVHGISPPIELASRQWALIQLTGLERAETPGFEAVRLQIQDSLLKARRESLRTAFIDKLRAEAKVVLHDDALTHITPTPSAATVKAPPVPKPAIKLNPSLLRPHAAPVPVERPTGSPSALPKEQGQTSEGSKSDTLRSYLNGRQNAAQDE